MPESPSSGPIPHPPEPSTPQSANHPEDSPQWTWLARIRRPQGRKGEVFADILTDYPEKFSDRRHLWLLPESPRPSKSSAPREVTLTNHWLHKGGIILHFSGFDSISDAGTLAGLIVAIPQTERVPLAEDEAYIGDLIGCDLYDATQLIGQIEDVDRTAGPVALLVVRGASGEILIPFAKSYLRKIDLAAKRVEMSLPEGLADLNAPDKH